MSIQKLSDELIDHIIDQLDDRDVFTIKSCSLVSHAIARRSRERLFEYIRRKVVSDEDQPALEQCLRESASRRDPVVQPLCSSSEAGGGDEKGTTETARKAICNSLSCVVKTSRLSLPCAAGLIQNIELRGDYLRPAPRVTTNTLRRILAYVPRLRRFRLHNFGLDSDPDEESASPSETKQSFKAIALEELDLQLDFRTTSGLIRVLRLFSRTTCLRLRQIVSSEVADFPQTQEEVEAQIDSAAPDSPLNLLVSQLELYLWQIGPVALELLRRAAYKSGVAVKSVRIRCDCGQRNLELLGAFFSDAKISTSVQHVSMVYPFYVPGPLPDFNALRLCSLSALSSLTVEGFYLGEIHSPQPPFALIARLLSSWSALPVTKFQLTLDIVFARRLTENLGPAISREAAPIDVTLFLADSPEAHWGEIHSVLSVTHFPKVMFMMRSQAGPMETEEKTRLMDTVYSKLRGLNSECDLTVEVSEP